MKAKYHSPETSLSDLLETRPDIEPRKDIQQEPPAGDSATWAGAMAGLIAGAAFSVYMMATNILQGRDLWVGAKMAGYPFLKDAAMRPGFEFTPVAVGLVCHFAVSVIWGVLFGWLARGRSRSVTLALGAVWGVIVWFCMYNIVLPLSGAGQLATMEPAGRAVLEHIGFGVVLAAAFWPLQTPPEDL